MIRGKFKPDARGELRVLFQNACVEVDRIGLSFRFELNDDVECAAQMFRKSDGQLFIKIFIRFQRDFPGVFAEKSFPFKIADFIGKFSGKLLV